MGDEALLSYAEIAELAGIRPSTLRAYRRRGYLPLPDEMLADRPRWRRSTVERWLRARRLGAETAAAR